MVLEVFKKLFKSSLRRKSVLNRLIAQIFFPCLSSTSGGQKGLAMGRKTLRGKDKVFRQLGVTKKGEGLDILNFLL